MLFPRKKNTAKWWLVVCVALLYGTGLPGRVVWAQSSGEHPGEISPSSHVRIDETAGVDMPGSDDGSEAETLHNAPTAAEGHDEHRSDGIFAGDWGTSFWTVLLFVLLLLVLRKWAWHPILEALRSREEDILRSIESAKESKQQAEALLHENREKLEAAQAEAQAMIAKSREDAMALAEELRQQAVSEAETMQKQAEEAIRIAKTQAVRDVYQEGVHIAVDLAGRLIERDLSEQDHEQLINDALKQLTTEELPPRS